MDFGIRILLDVGAMLFLSKYADWPKRPRWFTWPVVSWALYDTANTIFSYCIISRYFALWVTEQHKGSDIQYGMAMSLSMAAAAIVQITLSPVSDEMGRRKVFVFLFTLVGVAFTALIGWAGSLDEGLFLFACANIGAQCAMVFYNAMMADVADDRHLARISGIGTGVGYLGTLVGIFLVSRFAGPGRYSEVFVPTALLFLAFSLPLFLFVREQRGLQRVSFVKGMRNSVEAFATTLGHIARRKSILLFFVAILIGLEATHTVIQYMAVYAKKVMGMSEAKYHFLNVEWIKLGELDFFFLVTTLFAFVGAFFVGHLGDKWGHWRMLLVVMGVWAGALLLGAFSTSKEVFYAVGMLIAMGFGGIWTVSRSFLMAVSHPEEKSQMFAIFGLVNRGAAVIGPLIWGGTVHLFRHSPGIQYRAALLAMAGLMLIGLAVMICVRFEPRPLEIFPDRMKKKGH